MADPDDELYFVLDALEQSVQRLSERLSDPQLASARVWDLTAILLRHGEFPPPSFERARVLALRVVRSELIEAL